MNQPSLHSPLQKRDADPRATRIIQRQTVPVQFVEMPHAQLSFYADNPRTHSTLRADGREPSQAEIEKHLINLDHVKKLAANIEAEGGLHDPIIVRGGTLEVLEGNCRLAAYRLLSQTRGSRWDNIRCEVLPASISEDLVFSLLAQYHINGKLAWAPFEQAGFFFREFVADRKEPDRRKRIEALAAKGGGISTSRATHLIDTYGFMLENDDVNPDHWSHYDEYFKSRDISRARELHPELSRRFVEIVPHVPAEDIRKKLAKVCTQEKVLKRFISGALDLDDAFDLYRNSGADADAYQKFKRFRSWLAKDGVTEEILQYAGQERQKVALEVKKLDLLVSRLRRAMEDASVAAQVKPRRRRR